MPTDDKITVLGLAAGVEDTIPGRGPDVGPAATQPTHAVEVLDVGSMPPDTGQELAQHTPLVSEVQAHAIRLLLKGSRRDVVAGIVGVPEPQIAAWMCLPYFREALLLEVDQNRIEGLTRLHGLMDKAITTLAHVIENGDTDRERFQAARYVVDNVLGISSHFEKMGGKKQSKGSGTVVNILLKGKE